jgi:hypothetical protein
LSAGLDQNIQPVKMRAGLALTCISSTSTNTVSSGSSSGGRLLQARTVSCSEPKRTGISIGA